MDFEIGDRILTKLAEDARSKWKEWGLLNQHGQIILSQHDKLKHGTYFYDQYKILQSENKNMKLLSLKKISEKFPAWNNNTNHKRWKQGFISTKSGWVHATKGLEYIINRCQQNCVDIRGNTKIKSIKLVQRDGHKAMLETNNSIIIADLVIFACVVWLPGLLQRLQLPVFKYMKPVSNLVGYFRVKDSKNKWLFKSKRFPTFLADIEVYSCIYVIICYYYIKDLYF